LSFGTEDLRNLRPFVAIKFTFEKKVFKISTAKINSRTTFYFSVARSNIYNFIISKHIINYTVVAQKPGLGGMKELIYLSTFIVGLGDKLYV